MTVPRRTPAEQAACEAWVAWLNRPLSLRELFEIELRESCRQWGFCEATAIADALAAEAAADRVWDEVRSEVVLRDLDWMPENPWRE